MIVEAISVEPLFVPLREPFVIATARMDATRAGLVRVRLSNGVEGLGEAATLPPVTSEGWPDVQRAFASMRGGSLDSVHAALDALGPVARAALETALLDAETRARGLPFASTFGFDAFPVELETDVTLPIAETARMVELARAWRSRGFLRLKVKIGKDLDADVRALRAVHEAVPDAKLRLDANEGYDAKSALELLRAVADVEVELFEQPCARSDLEGMARVTREGGVIVVADESVRSLAELETIAEARAAHAVNLKLVKLGGPRAAHAVGARAKALGLRVMCGAMVETRLGLTAMAHVAASVGVDYVDLDTAFLLADDPFEGGFVERGPRLSLRSGAGLDVRVRER